MVLIGRDGCCRDIAGLHRNYRKVEETRLALQLVGELTALWRVRKCRWWLDKPVSNTGRLKTTILELAAQSGLDWEADLVYSPDSILSHTEQIVASADSVILDRCQRWFNLVRMVIDQRIPQSRMVDLSQALLPDCPL